MATARKTRKPKQPDDVEVEGLNEKGYCVKCKKKNTPMGKVVTITWVWMSKQNKYKPMLQGEHSKCGTKMTKFVSEEYIEGILADA